MAERILILHQGAIGDFILSLPALSTLRHAYPGATVEIWGYPDILKLVEKRFYADRIASVDRKEVASFYRENGAFDPLFAEQLKSFDRIVIFGQEGHNTFVDNVRRLKKNAVLWIKTFPLEGLRIHVVDYQLLQLEQIGLIPWERIPRLVLSEDDLLHASQEIRKVRGDEDSLLVALHTGSGSRKKNWPTPCFAHLIRILVKREGARVILLAGPAEEEGVEDFCTLLSQEGGIPLRNLPLRTLAGVLKGCSLYVGNDSGITHLAAAVGIPVVALFGPTDPQVWGPRGSVVSIVYRNVVCSPCSRDAMMMCSNRKCLEEITVEEVYEKVTNMLKRNPKSDVRNGKAHER